MKGGRCEEGQGSGRRMFLVQKEVSADLRRFTHSESVKSGQFADDLL